MKTTKNKTNKFITGKLYTDPSGEVLEFMGTGNDGFLEFKHHSGMKYYASNYSDEVLFSRGIRFFKIIKL